MFSSMTLMPHTHFLHHHHHHHHASRTRTLSHDHGSKHGTESKGGKGFKDIFQWPSNASLASIVTGSNASQPNTPDAPEDRSERSTTAEESESESSDEEVPCFALPCLFFAFHPSISPQKVDECSPTEAVSLPG